MRSPFHRFTLFGSLAFSTLLATRVLAVEPTPPAPSSPTVANPKNNPADCKNTAPGQPRSANCATIPDSTTPSTTTTPATPSKKAPNKTSTDEPPALPPTNNCTNNSATPTLPQSKSDCAPNDKSAPNQGGQYGH